MLFIFAPDLSLVMLRNQVREGILENAAVVRNPLVSRQCCRRRFALLCVVSPDTTVPPLQGNTHEDIDGLFGVLRRFLKNRSWSTLAELRALIAECLQLWVRPTAIYKLSLPAPRQCA